MENTLRELVNSRNTPIVWNLLAGITAAILALCMFGLRCRALGQCRLSCLLILRWICVADFCFIVHRIVFFLLNTVVMTIHSYLLMTWTCKLYHAFESLLILVQTWLLVLLAMERAAVKLRLRLGLRCFSRLRLRVGIAITGMLAVAMHINYIYVFAPRVISPLMLKPEMNETSNPPNNVSYSESMTVCSVDVGFETFFKYMTTIEVLLDVYLPVLIINSSAVVLCLHCAARGFTDLREHAVKLLPPGTIHDTHIAAFVVRCNNVMDVLFLAFSFVCYLPLEIMGICKALAVHKIVDDTNPMFRLYDLLNSLFLPAKNLLDALAIVLALIYLLSMVRLRCPINPPRRVNQTVVPCNNDAADEVSCSRKLQLGFEDQETQCEASSRGIFEPTDPIELIELNPSE